MAAMSRLPLLLFEMDASYQRLLARLAGTTDEEYLWEPVPGSWTVHVDVTGEWVVDYAVPDPDPPPFTTLAWRLLHLADCKVMYHEYAYGPGRLRFADLRPPPRFAEALERLELGHSLLRADLAGLSEADLDAPVGTNWGESWPAWRVFWTTIHHDAHHGAEIGCLRDLYRHGGGRPVPRRTGQG
jgi:hypothetical protein